MTQESCSHIDQPMSVSHAIRGLMYTPMQYDSFENFGAERRREKIAAYAYAFQRMLDLASGWMLIAPDIDFKIALGYKIGYDGHALKELMHRLGDMFAEPAVRCPTLTYANQFNHHLSLNSYGEATDFVIALLEDLKKSMTCYINSGNEIQDELTILILQNLLPLLEKQRQILSHWDSSQLLNIESIDTIEDASLSNIQEVIPTIPNFPARSPSLPYSPIADLDNKSYADTVRSPTSFKKLLHYIYIEIEIPAMESCARSILRYRDMPIAFRIDMSRQVWDEARHATFMLERLTDLGVQEGDYPYTFSTWRCYEMADNLLEALAIQQVILEGNGLDIGRLIATTSRAVGDVATADVFDYQNMDEVVHCRIGNKWVMYLTDHLDQAYEDIIHQVADKIGRTLPQPSVPVDVQARLLAGYPPKFVESLSLAGHLH